MLSVGSVPYLVGRPLDAGMEEEPGIEFRREVPAKLVAGLRDGRIDVALVSSIELFRRPGYSYLDQLAVAGHGHVSSVQVFLRRPLAEVRSIALDPASRTAAALTRVVWPSPGNLLPPEFREVEAGHDPRQAGTDAWLRIGDVALQETAESPPHGVFNPSRAFVERTGHPFIFALWIARPGVHLEDHVDLFMRARERGRVALATCVEQEARALGLSPEFLADYLQAECFFEPGAALTPSILAFRDGAAALGLAQGDLHPKAIATQNPA